MSFFSSQPACIVHPACLVLLVYLQPTAASPLRPVAEPQPDRSRGQKEFLSPKKAVGSYKGSDKDLHREFYAYSGNSTGDVVLSRGGNVSFSLRQKGGKRHSFTAYISGHRYADLDGLLMCVHLNGVKFKFILIFYACRIWRVHSCYPVREEEKEVHSLFVMKTKLKYEQRSVVNDGEFDNLVYII